MPNYNQDWFSRCIPQWRKDLKRFKDKREVQALEIGTYEGRSAVWLCENILNNVGSLYGCCLLTVDVKETKNAKDNIDELNRRAGFNICHRRIVSRSVEELTPQDLNAYVSYDRKWEGYFDFTYIDGDHSPKAIIRDALYAFNHCKVGGLITFDDYKLGPNLPAHKRPKLAIDFFLACFKDQLQIIHKGYQVTVLKKSSLQNPYL